MSGITPPRNYLRLGLLATALLLVVAALIIRYFTHASGLFVSAQPENGRTNPLARVVATPNSSGTGAIRFGDHTVLSSVATGASDCVAYGTQPSVGFVYHCYQITVDGQRRTYSLTRPSGSNSSSPLVIVLHPAKASSAYYEYLTNFDSAATANGFVVAYLDGLHVHQMDKTGKYDDPSWWSGSMMMPPTYAKENSFDDVDFIDSTIADLTVNQHIANSSRVFVVGSSAGALMVHRLACDSAITVKAFISISGWKPAPCANLDPNRRFNFLEIHGTADGVLPYAGKTFKNGETMPPVPQEISDWALRMNCDTHTTPSPTPNVAYGSVTSTFDHYTANTGRCNGYAVDLLTLVGGGHSWAQGIPGDAGITPYIVSYINNH